jgi:hypothetical protein
MRQDKVLWFALVFSTVIYAAMVFVLYPNPAGSFEDAARQQTTLILYGLAFASFVAGLVAPTVMRGPARVKMIVAMAVFESCAIYGLLAAMLARDYRLFVPAWIVALLGMWRMYPSGEISETPEGRATG